MSNTVIAGRTFDTRLFFGLVMVILATLMLPSIAQAQQSADDQYAPPTSPSGPAAESQCTVSGDTDGVANAGDVITCVGSFEISDGSSVVLQDADGTQGTFVDGLNATITEGSIVIAVTDEPINVFGGNGVLNTEGLFVVATTGITAADDTGGAVAANAEEPPSVASIVGVLPDTGGFAIFGTLGALALVGTGLLMFGGRFSRQR